MARDRLPAGLTQSMSVAVVSLGVVITFWNLNWPVSRGPELLVHIFAALCLFWGVVETGLDAWRPSWLHKPFGADLSGVLLIARFATGLPAVILMLYAAVTEGLCRTVFYDYERPWRVALWSSGWIDLGLLAAALFLGWRRTRDHQLMTALFWLFVLGSLWATFAAIPAVQRVRTETGAIKPVATPWISAFLLSSAIILAGFTLLSGRLRARWREGAWPDHLERLNEPPPHWPGFRYSAGVMGVVILILGCVVIVLKSTPVAALLAAVAILILVHRCWEENLADVGLGLVTLGVVSLFTPGFSGATWTANDFAKVVNGALFGLAVMTAVWHWLAAVWRQQLDGGIAWTTTGRMVHTAERVGYLVGATTVLVALHMAFWPLYPRVPDLDNSSGRWFWGLSGHAVAVLALIFAARRTNKPTLGWLVLFTMASAGAFTILRSPGSLPAQVWSNRWPLVVCAVAAVCVGLARLISAHPCRRPFYEPLFVTGLLVAPMAALAGLISMDRFRFPPGIVPQTFLSLAAVYFIAAWALGLRKLLILGVICLIASVVCF